MPNNAIIVFTFAGFPADYCRTTAQREWLDGVAMLQGYLPGAYSTIIRSETEPVAADRDKVWYQTNADGAPTGRVFTYAYGKWVAPNPVEASGQQRIWFEGSEADAWSYDGGDGTDPSSSAPTTTTGAMWEYDSEYAGRFPLMAGTTATPTTFSIGDVGGEETHTLTLNELPAAFSLTASLPGHRTNTETLGPQWLAPSGSAYSSVTNPASEVGTFPFTNLNGGVAMMNLPPYRVGAWLKRTARGYYTP